jgi:hypothetical protein
VPTVGRTPLGFKADPDLAERLECADCLLYAVWDSGEFVKVGKSCAHPRVRMAKLQTASPAPLVLLAYTAAAGALTEAALHRRFARWRVREGGGQEWFHCVMGLLRTLAREFDWVAPELAELLARGRRAACRP